MSNFTLKFYDLDTREDGRKLDRFGRLITQRTIEDRAKDRAKIEKAAQYLGPWCSNCGKRGKNCRNRYACNIRVINRHKVPPIPGYEQASRYAEAMRAQRENVSAAA